MKSLIEDMKTCYLDANLLVYFSDKNSQFHQQTKKIINVLKENEYQIVISSLCLDEFIHTVIRFSKDPKPITINNLKKTLGKIFKLKNLKLINPSLESKRHIKVINLIFKYNLKPRDAYHLFIMLENKIKYFATFDSDFDQVFKSGKLKKFNQN